jgi:NAD(P)-dependent dehydrogenase (short-subunit alcohol dehydrogenase family)
MEGGQPAAYKLSKSALNALTRLAAGEARGDVKVNAVDPGWVRTRMGGASASRDPSRAAADIVWAATLPAGGPHGRFLLHRKTAPW